MMRYLAYIVFLLVNYVANPAYALASESCNYPCDPLLDKALGNRMGTVQSAQSLEVGKPQKVTIPYQSNSQMTMNLVIPDKPKDDWFSISNIFALIALLLSAWSLRNSQKTEEKALAKSINDDFWMRTVTIPLTIKHVMELVTEGVGIYRDQDSNMRNFFEAYYLKKADLIRSSFLITAAISPTLTAALNSLVDDLEDSLSEAVDEEAVAACLSTFLSGVVSNFKSVQFNV
ncbi:hypothetical protein [Shewanella xiamenensis]|uniref:hypothetical protein n=1 Tax=Shewanella xiamenensis TaxID=332186 RepID=UPI001CC398E4|nr:hypothetical protein [Shewanella xiamenensis]BDA59745.1 hypothetical protein NUITMVS1_12080 [Shewanella xiamenensis]